jgi:hypothetical protein
MDAAVTFHAHALRLARLTLVEEGPMFISWARHFIRKTSRKSRLAVRSNVRGSRTLWSGVEAHEDRCLLTGTRTPLTNLLPDPVGATTEMVLSDGTVMIQGGGGFASNDWYKLTPDDGGSYINGTFSPRVDGPRPAVLPVQRPAQRQGVRGGS